MIITWVFWLVLFITLIPAVIGTLALLGIIDDRFDNRVSAPCFLIILVIGFFGWLVTLGAIEVDERVVAVTAEVIDTSHGKIVIFDPLGERELVDITDAIELLVLSDSVSFYRKECLNTYGSVNDKEYFFSLDEQGEILENQ